MSEYIGLLQNKKWRIQKITDINRLEKEGCRIGDDENRKRDCKN